jgi:hypothetical protein
VKHTVHHADLEYRGGRDQRVAEIDRRSSDDLKT